MKLLRHVNFCYCHIQRDFMLSFGIRELGSSHRIRNASKLKSASPSL